MLTQGHKVSVSVCLLLAKLLAVDNVYRHRKSAMCLVVCRIKIVNCGHCKFRNEFRRKSLHVKNICHWLKQFK